MTKRYLIPGEFSIDEVLMDSSDMVATDFRGRVMRMSEVYQFNVSLRPDEALELIKEGMTQESELMYEELNDLGAGRMIGTLVYERFYFRSGNQAALVIIADNLKGISNVRLIPAGGARGKIFKFDWGAGKDFSFSVEQILSKYIYT